MNPEFPFYDDTSTADAVGDVISFEYNDGKLSIKSTPAKDDAIRQIRAQPFFRYWPRKFTITGVCLGWDLKPHLSFDDGHYLYGNADKILYPEYWEKDPNWPHCPITGNRLEIERHD